MCFIRSWNTGLEAMWTAAWLSHYNLVDSKFLKPTSSNSYRTHRTSHTPCVIARYSDLALDPKTTTCFLLLHDIRLSPTKTQYPVVDLLSIFDPASLHQKNIKYLNAHDYHRKDYALEPLSFQITKNLSQSFPTTNAKRGHKLAHNANRICNVWVSHHQII